MNITDTVKEVVSIVVKTGNDVSARVVSNPDDRINAGQTKTYNLTINDTGDGVLVNGEEANTTNWNNASGVDIAAPATNKVTTADKDYDDGGYIKTANSATDANVIVIKVDGVVPAYHVWAPNVAGYDIEANYDINRESSDNFVSAVPAGEKYRFKLNLAPGSTKSSNFKVKAIQHALRRLRCSISTSRCLGRNNPFM